MGHFSKFSLIYRMNSLCERPCRQAQALTHSQCAAALSRSRRDFKERAFLMAEERGSVANGREYFNTFWLFLQVENQIIVTRERTS